MFKAVINYTTGQEVLSGNKRPVFSAFSDLLVVPMSELVKIY